ncbi:hypothetical protein ACFU7Y_20570 [Kitasatospora sp. NPDC057542]|uniref:hypothetical protein n=1 Tax=Kitasatospora sp. NPDC057542 TaxID=3346162 RepID=UPI0036B492CD
MSDPITSGTANIGDTVYSWLSTAVGDILYATRTSGQRERLLMGLQVQRIFETLTQHPGTEPLEQLRREQRILEQARQEEAARQEQAREEVEHRELQQALDAGAITPEAYVRALADLAARRSTPPPSLQERLDDHRILARLEHDLQVGRVGQILDAVGSERTPGADDAVLSNLEALWHDAPRQPSIPTTTSWTDRPHGHVPAATLTRQLSWLKEAIRHFVDQAKRAETEAAALTTDAEHGRGPAARAVRQGIQAGRAAAETAREATANFQSSNAHIRRSLALHQAADDAERRAHAGPAHLLLRGMTRTAQQGEARQLREQAELARDAANSALTAATAALTRARALRATTSHQLQHPHAANQTLESAVERDTRDADGQARDLLSAAARLRAKVTSYQDHLNQLTEEANTRSDLDPRQRIAEDRERETPYRQRRKQGAPARAGRRMERQPHAGRRPNPPAGGPSPT